MPLGSNMPCAFLAAPLAASAGRSVSGPIRASRALAAFLRAVEDCWDGGRCRGRVRRLGRLPVRLLGMGISGLDGTGLVKPCSSMARSGSSSAGCCERVKPRMNAARREIRGPEKFPPLIPPQMNEICIWLKCCRKMVKA